VEAVESLDDGRDIERPRAGRCGRVSSGGVGWKVGRLDGVGVRISRPIGCWWTSVEAVVSYIRVEKRRSTRFSGCKGIFGKVRGSVERKGWSSQSFAGRLMGADSDQTSVESKC
jgi:hypothetical protein